jgi:hypothetical protein
VGRRAFLVSLLTGTGAAASLGGSPTKAAPAREQETSHDTAAEPILYRRTKEAERYYRTLYT